ncbi:13s condensin subunit [Vairimorpha apis BRL 01]|uniref:13s condensin subunit n=1 Tax=Vairimorpha apis BRL 01 TaxID=1037528 RepID=T0KWR1_9MICR|nr:13s condensin subunit [Vairimorpha apis BRL 01]
MVFFDYQVLENTVNFIYKNTLDPEQACKSLLIMLEKKNLNILKSIYIVGCVGINHLRYLEILERKYKERNEKINIEIPEEIKERRKSINASRLSLMIDDGDENDSKIIKFNDNFVMENKSEEEIADFFFYLKEKDILYNPDGLLYEYSKKIIEYTNIKELEEVAIISLYKLMCISSEFFTEYKHFISKGFKSDNYKIRSNCIISIGDFLLLYNSMVDEINILFEGLIDTNKIVRKNALLVIYNLLKRNILRLGNKSIYLSNLIFDEDEEIKLISRNIIYNMSENDNFIVTLVYEKFVKEINNSDLDFFLPLLKEKSREMIFLKLIKTSQNKDMLKVMYNKFNMSEKFINDIKHMEEFKILGVC